MHAPIGSVLTRCWLVLMASSAVIACGDYASEPAGVREAELETVQSWSDDWFAYRLVELEGERFVVGEGVDAERRVVIVGDEDGALLAIAVLEDGRARRVDVDQALTGDLDAPAGSGTDPQAERVLELVLQEPQSRAAGLGLTTEPEPPLPLGCFDYQPAGNGDTKLRC